MENNAHKRQQPKAGRVTDSEVGHLAFRIEGNMLNAYWAMPDTMKDALWLGSIARAGIDNNDKRRDAFVDLMREMVGDILQEITGKHVANWETRPADASERTQE